MDICNPKINIGIARSRLKANFGVDAPKSFTSVNICGIYKRCRKQATSLPPLQIERSTSGTVFMTDPRCILKIDEYMDIIGKSRDLDKLKSYARKIGLGMEYDSVKSIRSSILQFLKSSDIIEPIQLPGKVKVDKEILESNMNRNMYSPSSSSDNSNGYTPPSSSDNSNRYTPPSSSDNRNRENPLPPVPRPPSVVPITPTRYIAQRPPPPPPNPFIARGGLNIERMRLKRNYEQKEYKRALNIQKSQLESERERNRIKHQQALNLEKLRYRGTPYYNRNDIRKILSQLVTRESKNKVNRVTQNVNKAEEKVKQAVMKVNAAKNKESLNAAIKNLNANKTNLVVKQTEANKLISNLKKAPAPVIVQAPGQAPAPAPVIVQAPAPVPTRSMNINAIIQELRKQSSSNINKFKKNLFDRLPKESQTKYQEVFKQQGITNTFEKVADSDPNVRKALQNISNRFQIVKNKVGDPGERNIANALKGLSEKFDKIKNKI